MMDPFSLHYSDYNKKNTFNNSDNNGHELKNVTCKQTLQLAQSASIVLRIRMEKMGVKHQNMICMIS